MENFISFLEWLGEELWGTPFIVFTIVIGVYYIIATRAFSFVHLGHIFKNTFGTLTKKESRTKAMERNSG